LESLQLSGARLAEMRPAGIGNCATESLIGAAILIYTGSGEFIRRAKKVPGEAREE